MARNQCMAEWGFDPGGVALSQSVTAVLDSLPTGVIIQVFLLLMETPRLWGAGRGGCQASQ